MRGHNDQHFRMFYLEGFFHHILVFCILALSRGGQVNANAQTQSLIVMLGEDVALPCQLDPPVDAVSMTVEWARPDLEPRFVFVWHDGKQLLVDQNEAYKKRASLSTNRLKRGDVSLTLPKVRVSDNGTYRCYIPDHDEEYFVDLLVGSVSSPDISMAGIDRVNGGVMLDCVSRRWFPQPEVSWSDSEGKLLSAGPTEAVRGPDGLFTVSSRVTVEKRHNNNFTCRLHQRNINQTRASHLHVPDDFFVVPSSCSSCITISVLLSLILVFTVVFGVWRWRKSKMKDNGEEGEGVKEKLMKEKKKSGDLEKQLKLKEDLLKKEEEEKEMTQIIETLNKLTVEVKTKKENLSTLMKEADKQMKEREEKIKLVDTELSEQKDKTSYKAHVYPRLMKMLNEDNWNETKRGLQQLDVVMDKLNSGTKQGVGKISEMRKKMVNDIELIKNEVKQLENQGAGSQEQNKVEHDKT